MKSMSTGMKVSAVFALVMAAMFGASVFMIFRIDGKSKVRDNAIIAELERRDTIKTNQLKTIVGHIGELEEDVYGKLTKFEDQFNEMIEEEEAENATKSNKRCGFLGFGCRGKK